MPNSLPENVVCSLLRWNRAVVVIPLLLSTVWLSYQLIYDSEWLSPHASPLFRPLKSAGGIPGMGSLVITLGGVRREEREHGRALVAVTGAALARDLQRGCTTHLVCADGSEKARRRRRKLVAAEPLG